VKGQSLKRLPIQATRLIICLLLFAIVLNFTYMKFEDPQLEAREQLLAHEWEHADLVLLSGEVSRSIFSASAQSSFRSLRSDRPGTVHISIRRSFPFGGWIVTEYGHEQPTGD